MKFYRQFIAILLLVAVLTNCFSYWILYSSYSLNKKYISTVLCANRSHPEAHCEGKCILHLKLRELEQKNKQDQDLIKRMIETIKPVHFSLTLDDRASLADLTIKYLLKKTTKAVNPIFQPPQQV